MQQHWQRLAQVRVQSQAHASVLAEFALIEIDMDDICVAGKGLRAPDHPIVEAHPESQYKVSLIYGDVGTPRPVHTQRS